MPKTILVAESCGRVTERLEVFLSRRGYRVQSAANGLECLQSLRESLPDVLLLDVDLPWGCGNGVLACMREDGTSVQVPVILLTERFSRDVDTSDPVVRCLRRPFDVRALRDAVDSLIGMPVARVS